MRKADVIQFFGGQYGARAKIARLLGLSRAAVSNWGDVIPEVSARRLDELTNGELPFDESLYRDKGTDAETQFNHLPDDPGNSLGITDRKTGTDS